jgi:hypothetical protein
MLMPAVDLRVSGAFPRPVDTGEAIGHDTEINGPGISTTL